MLFFLKAYLGKPILRSLLLIVVSLVLAPITLAEEYGGKEYRWIKERKTQAEAQAQAESLGGHLVVINSSAEQNFVYSMVQGNTDPSLGTASDGGGAIYVWLGGNDSSREGTWVWVNGDPFTYTNWGRREPDNYNNNQDGLALGLENWPFGSSSASAYGLAGQWNDINRSNRLTFIVELPLQSNEEGTDNQDEDTGAGDSSGDGGSSDGGSSGSGSGQSGGGKGINRSADFISAPYDFDYGDSQDRGCAIDDNGLRCWNLRTFFDDIPDLVNPRQVSLGYGGACVIDDTGLVCWGDRNFMAMHKEKKPSLSNPSIVYVGDVGFKDFVCALDESGVVCWSEEVEGGHDVDAVVKNVPALVNPRELAGNMNWMCAIDDTGVVCWGPEGGGDGILEVPEFVNPTSITLGKFHACVIDEGRVPCWNNGFRSYNNRSSYDQPRLVNPRQVVAGGYHVCALDDQGVKCWGQNNHGETEVPFLINPSRILDASRDSTCALDDTGVVCWGLEDDVKSIPFDLSFSSWSKRVVTQYLQTTSASQNISTLDVINTSERSQTFRGILRGGSGEKVGLDQPVLGSNVPSMGRLSLTSSDLEDIFEIAPWSGPAMLTIQGDSTFDLMSKLESPSGLVSNTNCVRDNRVLNLEGFDSDNLSYVRLINTGANTTGAVTGTLYAADGSVVGTANTRLVPKLDPYQQTWVSRDRLSSLIGAEWNGEGMLEVNPVPGLKLLNLNFVTDESTFFNFSCGEKASVLVNQTRDNPSGNGRVVIWGRYIARAYLQTTSTSANVSLTHLVNTSDSPQEYKGTLYGSDGVQVGSADQPLHSGTVPAKGRLIISSADIESVFNISPWSGPAVLDVTGMASFELMTKLESPSGLVSNTNCVRTEQVHNVGGFNQTDVSYVRFINIGSTDLTNIRGTLFDDTGTAVGSADQVLVDSLPAKSHVWSNRSQLSTAIGARWNGTASLRITSPPEDLRLLNLNYVNGETFFNFSCYESGN